MNPLEGDEFAGLGEALRRLREDRGLTQKELAQRSGTARRVVNSWETGRNLPRVPTLEGALEALGADLFELLGTIEAVNGRPPVRFHRLLADPRQRDGRLAELLGIGELPPPRQALLLAAVDQLRGLFTHLASVTAALATRR